MLCFETFLSLCETLGCVLPAPAAPNPEYEVGTRPRRRSQLSILLLHRRDVYEGGTALTRVQHQARPVLGHLAVSIAASAQELVEHLLAMSESRAASG